MLLEQARRSARLPRRVGRGAVEVVERAEREVRGDALAHVALEARRMGGGEADVLVHVEAGDA